MELDRKVREFSVPDPVADFIAAVSGTSPSKPQDRDIGVTEPLGCFYMSNVREVSELIRFRQCGSRG